MKGGRGKIKVFMGGRKIYRQRSAQSEKRENYIKHSTPGLALFRLMDVGVTDVDETPKGEHCLKGWKS